MAINLTKGQTIDLRKMIKARTFMIYHPLRLVSGGM